MVASFQAARYRREANRAEKLNSFKQTKQVKPDTERRVSPPALPMKSTGCVLLTPVSTHN